MIYHIGFPKTGTTFIHQVIKKNEKFDCPISKDHSTFTYNKDRFNKAKYLKLFKNNNQIKFDFDHSLIYDFEGLRLLKDNFIDVKVILVLRNNEDLLISNFLFQISQGKYSLNKNSFKLFLVNEKDEIFVYEHIRKLFEIFNNKNILVLNFEDLNKNPNKFFKDLAIFTKIENISIPSLKKVNKARKPRFGSDISLVFRRASLILRNISPFLHTILKNNKYIKIFFFTEIDNKDKNLVRSWLNSDLRHLLKNDASKINLLLSKNK